MGLEQFMGDLGVESEESETTKKNEEDSTQPDYTYNGEEEILDVSFQAMKDVLDSTDYDFKEQDHPTKGRPAGVKSEGGQYRMLASYPSGRADRDCILVHVLDSDTGYDVIEPYPVYLVEGWKEKLEQAINTIEDKQDELVFCDRCEGIMIIRTTNTTSERIRGCSNYPDCRNSDVLSNGT